MFRAPRVQVPFFNPGVLCHVVHDWFIDGNVVIYERNPFVFSARSKHGHAAQTMARRVYDDSIAVGGNDYLLADQGHKLSVDSNMSAGPGNLDTGFQRKRFRAVKDASDVSQMCKERVLLEKSHFKEPL